MDRKKSKIIPVRRINFVNVIFGVMIVYLLAIGLRYALKEKIKIYEVTKGSLAVDNQFRGVALRDEVLVKSSAAGYIKCYLQNGDVTGLGKAIFAIDETGKTLKTQNSVNSNESTLSSEDLSLLEKYLQSYSINYNRNDFSKVYNFKNQLQALVYGIEVDKINQNSQEKDSSLQVENAKQSGIVLFQYDGYENGKITADSFNEDDYSATYISTGKQVKKNDIVAKIIPSQEWSIVIQLTEAQAQEYREKKKITIYLKDIDKEIEAKNTIITDDTGKSYAKLTIDHYLASYLESRFLNIKIVNTGNQIGLKVPKSAVITREFYSIPKKFVETNEEIEYIGIYLDAANGKKQYQEINNYISDGNNYYVDKSILAKEDVLVQAKGDAAYTINEIKSLEGVYCVNKGYAVFKEVDILDNNDQYYIVKIGTNYGLAVYDRIVLNAVDIDEEQFLY